MRCFSNRVKLSKSKIYNKPLIFLVILSVTLLILFFSEDNLNLANIEVHRHSKFALFYSLCVPASRPFEEPANRFWNSNLFWHSQFLLAVGVITRVLRS